MENKTKILNLLSLAMRTGKLITDEELTLRDIHTNKTKFMFVAQGASENIRKKIKDENSYYNVPVSELFDQFELSQAIGRPRMVIGVADAGFATKVKGLLKGQEGDCMGKKRIYELAKGVNEAGKDVVDEMRQLGIDVRNHMGTISPEQEAKLRQAFGGGNTVNTQSKTANNQKQQTTQNKPANRKPMGSKPDEQRNSQDRPNNQSTNG